MAKSSFSLMSVLRTIPILITLSLGSPSLIVNKWEVTLVSFKRKRNKGAHLILKVSTNNW